jgi:CoA:oxalate CoA-transferase
MQTAIQSGLIAASAAIGVLLDPPAQGGPTVVDISETDVWATVHAGTTVVAFLFSNRMRRREGHRVLGQPYPHQLFRCKDGWIAIQGSERKQYDEFVDMVGSPEWASDRRFGSRMEMNFRHADEIDELLAPWFMQRTTAEIFAECRKRKIPAAPVRSISQVREDPDIQVRGELESFRGASGVEVTVPAPPFRFRSATLRPAGPAPQRARD